MKALKYAVVAVALAALTPLAQAATPGDTLVIAKQIDDIISLDPAEAYELSGIEMVSNTYDRIMRFEPTDVTKLVPGVAESVEVTDAGRTFTFKIRAGQTFASGNPVTAGDAAWSLQRVIKLEKTPVFLLSQLGWTKDNIDAMVTAPDDSTLVVKIGVDFAPSLVYALLGSVVGSVVDQKVAMEHETAGDMGNGWLKNNSAGSGAYVLKSWTPNEAVMLEANPNYRGGVAALKRVVVRHIPEASAQRLALEKGDVDIADNLTPDQIAAIAGNGDITVTTIPQALLYYIGFNNKMKELSDPKVRQALRYLIDYDGMANSFLKGAAQVHQSFWAEGFWASYNENPYTLDVAKAKALLAEAGFPNGFETEFVTYVQPTSWSAAQQNYLQAVGIKVKITQLQVAAAIQGLARREPALSRQLGQLLDQRRLGDLPGHVRQGRQRQLFEGSRAREAGGRWRGNVRSGGAQEGLFGGRQADDREGLLAAAVHLREHLRLQQAARIQDLPRRAAALLLGKVEVTRSK